MKTMEITTEQIAELESKIATAKEALAKAEEFLTDIKACNGASTEMLIYSAAKKQLQAVGIVA